MDFLEKAIKNLEECPESLKKGSVENKVNEQPLAKSTTPAQVSKPEQPVREWFKPVQFFGAVPKQDPLKKATDTAVTPTATIASNPANLLDIPVSPLGTFMPRKIDYNSLKGYQLVALKAGLDPCTPGIERMTFGQMKEMARLKTLNEIVKPQRRALGIPDPVEPPRNFAIPSY